MGNKIVSVHIKHVHSSIKFYGAHLFISFDHRYTIYFDRTYHNHVQFLKEEKKIPVSEIDGISQLLPSKTYAYRF